MPKADFSRYLGISATRGREHVAGGITRSAETHRQRAARYRMEALCKGIRLDAAGVAAFRRAVADDVGGLAAAIWPWLGPVPGTRSSPA